MSRDMVPINIRDPFMKDPFFSSTWDEFDAMRAEMMEKSKSFWGQVDKDVASFEDAVRRQHDELDRQVAPFRPQLPRWAIPDAVRDKWPAATNADANEVIKVRDDADKFEVTLDVSHYRPEDLKVSTVNNVLSIEGKHEEDQRHAAEGCARSSSVVRQFARKWTLPGDCDPNDVISNLSSDGVLMVTAPRKGLTHDPRKAIQH